MECCYTVYHRDRRLAAFPPSFPEVTISNPPNISKVSKYMSDYIEGKQIHLLADVYLMVCLCIKRLLLPSNAPASIVAATYQNMFSDSSEFEDDIVDIYTDILIYDFDASKVYAYDSKQFRRHFSDVFDDLHVHYSSIVNRIEPALQRPLLEEVEVYEYISEQQLDRFVGYVCCVSHIKDDASRNDYLFVKEKKDSATITCVNLAKGLSGDIGLKNINIFRVKRSTPIEKEWVAACEESLRPTSMQRVNAHELPPAMPLRSAIIKLAFAERQTSLLRNDPRWDVPLRRYISKRDVQFYQCREKSKAYDTIAFLGTSELQKQLKLDHIFVVEVNKHSPIVSLTLGTMPIDQSLVVEAVRFVVVPSIAASASSYEEYLKRNACEADSLFIMAAILRRKDDDGYLYDVVSSPFPLLSQPVNDPLSVVEYLSRRVEHKAKHFVRTVIRDNATRAAR